MQFFQRNMSQGDCISHIDKVAHTAVLLLYKMLYFKLFIVLENTCHIKNTFFLQILVFGMNAGQYVITN